MKPETHRTNEERKPAPHDDRRRSQRVTLRVEVQLLVSIHGNETAIQACTVSVNDHGALLSCEHFFAANDRFTLEHKFTRSRIACRVTRKPQEAASGYQVAVEFEKAAPNFWEIAFPPRDWQPME